MWMIVCCSGVLPMLARSGREDRPGRSWAAKWVSTDERLNDAMKALWLDYGTRGVER